MTNGLQIITQNGQLVTDSRDVAEMVGKEHKVLLRDIRRIFERFPDIKKEFFLTAYRDSQSQMRPCYHITDKGVKFIKNKYKYRQVPHSLEKSFSEWLYKLFPNELIEEQYQILNYKIDFYMSGLGICIEYDERKHMHKQDFDRKRESEIQEELKRKYLEEIEDDPVIKRREAKESFSFLRVREGYEIEAIRELLFLIRDRTSSDVLMYME